MKKKSVNEDDEKTCSNLMTTSCKLLHPPTQNSTDAFETRLKIQDSNAEENL
jgi:hypothetical protein